MHVLSGPADLHRELMAGADRARVRVTLAALYIGSGSKEKQVLASLDAGARNSTRTTHIVLDRARSARSAPAGTSGSDDDVLATLLSAPRVRLSLLAAPWASSRMELPVQPPSRGGVPAGWNISTLLRVSALLREVLGVQHIKGAVFDDDVILTGANVSADYLSTRQDRYLLIRGCAPLASFMCDLLDTLAAAEPAAAPSSLGRTQGADRGRDARPQARNRTVAAAIPEGVGAEFCDSCEEARNRIASAAVRALFGRAHEESERSWDGMAAEDAVWLVPAVQMGGVGFTDESDAVRWLLRHAAGGGGGERPWARHRLLLSSPYLNLPAAYEDALLCRSASGDEAPPCHSSHAPSIPGPQALAPPPAPVHAPVLLTAAPEANGFFGARGLRSLIPAAYRALEHQLVRRAARHGGASSSVDAGASAPPRLRLRHYSRPGWSFHAKGLWLWPAAEHQGAAARGEPAGVDDGPPSPHGDRRSTHRSAEPGAALCGSGDAGLGDAGQGDAGPVVSLIGSTNLSERSVRRDLELSFFVVATSAGVRAQLRDEAAALLAHSEEVETPGTHAQAHGTSAAGRLVAWLMRRYL